MPYSDIYLYSPLSIKSVKEGHNRALLLQFMLSELFHTMDAEKKDDPLEFVFSSPACFFPYDWSYEVGCLNKLAEHSKLLSHGFPKLKSAIETFNSSLEELLATVTMHKKMKEKVPSNVLFSGLKELYHFLEPFIIACKESEDLLVFLMKHTDEIGQLAEPENVSNLLTQMFPEGFDAISHLIRRAYQNRGFTALLPEIDQLLSQYD